jgi:hypothetical protein
VQGFGGETWEKESNLKSRHWRKDNNEMDLKEMGWEVMDSTGLTQDRDKWTW